MTSLDDRVRDIRHAINHPVEQRHVPPGSLDLLGVVCDIITAAESLVDALREAQVAGLTLPPAVEQFTAELERKFRADNAIVDRGESDDA